MKTLAPFSINLFKNASDKVTFAIAKGKSVKADYFALDEQNKKSIRGIDAVSKDGLKYIAIQVADQSVTPNTYFRGALFPNDRKTAENQPDMRGSLDLHDEGEQPTRLQASAWSKEKVGGKAGVYFSISFQVPQAKAEGDAAPASTPTAEFDPAATDVPY